MARTFLGQKLWFVNIQFRMSKVRASSKQMSE